MSCCRQRDYVAVNVERDVDVDKPTRTCQRLGILFPIRDLRI